MIFMQLMLCGMQEIDVDDWERHAVYKTYTAAAPQVQWFWKVKFVSLLKLSFLDSLESKAPNDVSKKNFIDRVMCHFETPCAS